MKQLYRFIKFFGIKAGMILWINLNLQLTSKLQLPELRQPFRIRPATTDLAIFGQIFLNRCYDFDIKAQPSLIIDGGANIGLASIFFASKFPSAEIIAIEPQTNNYDLLVENTSNYKNITSIKGALWHCKTQLTLTDEGHGESGFVIKDSEKTSSMIHAYTLAEIAKKRIIDILKIDIEGSERELFFTHYEDWLPNVKYLIIEIHDQIREGASKNVFKALNNYNFSLSLRGENLIFINNNLI